MSIATVPKLAADVVLRQVGTGEYVLKHRPTRSYFRIGETEHFLFSQLDGRSSAAAVRAAFAQRFSEPLSEEELSDFLEMTRSHGLIEGATASAADEAEADAEAEDLDSPRKQSWLYFRVRLFDPGWLLQSIEPVVRWVWTPTFACLAVLYVLSAAVMVWTQRADFVSSFHAALRWESLCLVWLSILGATVLHEFAHGLTCKHYGGDVHEIGALMIFFMPSMYCDVSDSWLIPNRWHRLFISLAGSVSDLLVFATAAFVWRVTVLDSALNYVAWVLATVCGTRVLLNLNPLMRLDGYYLASDWLEIPNLRPAANAYWKAHLRHWLWGAARPERRPRGGWLLWYGGAAWCFAVVAFDAIGLALLHYLHAQFGWLGVAMMSVLALLVGKRVFQGLFTSELATMLKTRPQRTAAWLAGLGAAAVAAVTITVDRHTTGEFQIHPGVRYEVRAEVSGFLKELYVAEGAAVHAGQVLARLEMPDLASLMVRKEAEIRESEAYLRKLKMGPRREELVEQAERVRRAAEWRALAVSDLERARQVYEQDLLRYDLEIKQYQTELEFQRVSLQNAERLYRLGALAGESRRAEQKRFIMLQTQLEQTNAQRRSRQAEGVRSAEAELARREKDLADTQAALKLLEAGTRPEEIEVETARLARLNEELSFLQAQQSKLDVKSPMDGVVVTPRLQERLGQLTDQGGVVCMIEDIRRLSVEIAVPEEELAGVRPGQKIQLKARALPFERFEATVDQIAPSANGANAANAAPSRGQSRVIVYCHVENEEGLLKSGMTGYARIQRGTQTIAKWGARQTLKYIRTEFWW